jgi:DNA mismatch repair protein MutS
MAHKTMPLGDAVTPLMRQYLAIKEQCRDAILFFRLGDFYEMFFDDAVLASKLLDITLTSRNKHDDNPIPLCGVPYHSAEPYIAKLLENGKKVAICEQVEDPKLSKGVVRRAVTKIYTPGVVPEGAVLDDTSSNYVAAVWWEQDSGGMALADISTGHFTAAAIDTEEVLIEELAKREPREILIPRSGDAPSTVYGRLRKYIARALFSPLDDDSFRADAIASLEGARGLAESSEPAARAAGAVHAYLSYTQRGEISSIDCVERYLPGESMRLDESTKRKSAAHSGGS